jgi:Zn-dependent peptidase ImmA (M78 family)
LQSELSGLEGGYVCRYRQATAEQGFEEIQAHKFMGYVLLPADLLRPLLKGRELLKWGVLYELREACGVTISALVRRLEGMKLLYVDEYRQLHRSKEVARGQGALF